MAELRLHRTENTVWFEDAHDPTVSYPNMVWNGMAAEFRARSFARANGHKIVAMVKSGTAPKNTPLGATFDYDGPIRIVAQEGGHCPSAIMLGESEVDLAELITLAVDRSFDWEERRSGEIKLPRVVLHVEIREE